MLEVDISVTGKDNIERWSNDVVFARFEDATGAINSLLRFREDLIEVMNERKMYDRKAPSGLQGVAHVVAEKMNLPVPMLPKDIRKRDETAFWVNMDGLETLLTAFMRAGVTFTGNDIRRLQRARDRLITAHDECVGEAKHVAPLLLKQVIADVELVAYGRSLLPDEPLPEKRT